jgi:diaminopimelate decarboxylase
MHIGSQITDLKPYRDAFTLMRDLAGELRRAGHPIEHLDLGGGLGVPYRSTGNDILPTPRAYADLVREILGGLGLKLVLEPGRVIVANAGVLVTRTLYVKHGRDKVFTVVDAAMNDLIRPTLYEAEHEIWPVREAASEAAPVLQDVVGPVCETGDYLAQGRVLPPCAPGDLLAIMSAGAYGAAMSSTYNSRLLVPEVLVKGAQRAIVRPRPSYADLIGLDRLPGWLG